VDVMSPQLSRRPRYWTCSNKILLHIKTLSWTLKTITILNPSMKPQTGIRSLLITLLTRSNQSALSDGSHSRPLTIANNLSATSWLPRSQGACKRLDLPFPTGFLPATWPTSSQQPQAPSNPMSGVMDLWTSVLAIKLKLIHGVQQTQPTSRT
jgi:hypothetical protein